MCCFLIKFESQVEMAFGSINAGHKLAPVCVPSGAVSVEAVGDWKCVVELELASQLGEG